MCVCVCVLYLWMDYKINCPWVQTSAFISLGLFVGIFCFVFFVGCCALLFFCVCGHFTQCYCQFLFFLLSRLFVVIWSLVCLFSFSPLWLFESLCDSFVVMLHFHLHLFIGRLFTVALCIFRHVSITFGDVVQAQQNSVPLVAKPAAALKYFWRWGRSSVSPGPVFRNLSMTVCKRVCGYHLFWHQHTFCPVFDFSTSLYLFGSRRWQIICGKWKFNRFP